MNDKIRLLNSTIGAWEPIIIQAADTFSDDSDKSMQYVIAEVLPKKIIDEMKIEDKDDSLYCSNEAFEMVCNKVFQVCELNYPKFAYNAQYLLDNGY